MTVMPKNKRDQEVPEDSADRSSWSEDQKVHKYYYDDAHGYEEYDPTKDKTAVPLHEPRQRRGGTWDKGGANAYSSPVHKSETVDYGILLEGERVLLLDNGTYVMTPGDVVVQLGNWHGWANPGAGSLMAFVMMGAKYDE